jgi:cytochrome c-type biogenesis protein CcmH/NrfG
MEIKLKRLLVIILAMVLLSGCVKLVAREETRSTQQRSPREKAALQLTEEGRQLLDKDQPDQAIRSLEQAISLNPDNGPCYYYLAEAWLQKGNFSEARQFNSLAENYLKKDKGWNVRLARQADKIDDLEK